jgi:hypothetical protein
MLVGRQVVRDWTFGRCEVTTTDHDSAGNSVLVTAMFCKWCEADPNVMMEDVPQDIVIKTLKVSCACVSVLVFACVCVCLCVRATSICVRENLHLHFLIFVCVCACNREGTSHTSSRVDGRLE